MSRTGGVAGGLPPNAAEHVEKVTGIKDTPYGGPVKPTLGRIVLYTEGDASIVPAIVTYADSALVKLTCFRPGWPPYPAESTSEGTLPGEWAWPPRV
jgi:hypothetical protein